MNKSPRLPHLSYNLGVLVIFLLKVFCLQSERDRMEKSFIRVNLEAEELGSSRCQLVDSNIALTRTPFL